jgi:aldehyde:ferredoxin oxidoreductase
MARAKGYTGRILRADLTERKLWVEEPDDTTYRKYLGGGALACYYLLKELAPGVDPLGPENILVFMTSAMNGTPLSGANRYTAAAKSPLTDGYGESEAGGYWGPELKNAGFDGVIVTGQASEPAYLWLHDGEAEIRDATKWWGQLSGEVQDGLSADVNDKYAKVLQTGVSGENLVRFAAITNQCRHFHGRAGLGAVMGSKRLKAIVVRGKIKVQLEDKGGTKGVMNWFKENYERNEDRYHLYGTAGGVRMLQADGILPTRNFRQGNFEGFEEISGQRMADTILTNRGTCYACTVACKREVTVEELGVDPKYGGPEYETLAANGSLQGTFNLKKLALANQYLSQHVLDSISTGAVIAFAMECFENGLLTQEDTGGIDLRFGNEDAATQLIPMIARREGIGDLLADGVMRAAERIGPGAVPFALHVKGQELPMHEPRGKKSLALAYATSPTGADHMEAPHDPFYEGFHADGSELGPLGLIEPVKMLDLGSKKVRAFYYCQQVWNLYNTVGMCDFVGTPIGALQLQKLVDYVNAVTGWDTSLWELLKAAERSQTLFRVFNCREGMTPEDDSLPDRMFEPLENGPLAGEKIERDQFERAKRLYYQMAGWDAETGRPTPARLAELGLEWAAPEEQREEVPA